MLTNYIGAQKQKHIVKLPGWTKFKTALKHLCYDKQAVTVEDAKSYETQKDDCTPEQLESVKLNIYNTKKVISELRDNHEHINEFEIIKELGSGGFSTVYLAHRKYMENGEVKEFPLALKAMLLSSLKKDKFICYSVTGEQAEVTALEKAYNEINIMGQCNHENIVKIYEIIEEEGHDYLYIALELCHFGQIADWSMSSKGYVRNQKLVDYILSTHFEGQEFDSEEAKVEEVGKYIFKGALKGLEYLHGEYIAHRDIKPDNIFFSKHGDAAKLGDFTVSVKMFDADDKTLSSKAGTSIFMAPEIEPPEEEGKKTTLTLFR